MGVSLVLRKRRDFKVYGSKLVLVTGNINAIHF